MRYSTSRTRMRPLGVGSVFSSLFMCLFGAVFLLIPFVLLSKGGPYDHGSTVHGSITAVSVGTTSKGGHTCTPTVSYVVNEQRYTATADIASSDFCDRSVGESMDVSYLPANPAAGRVLYSPSKFLYLFAAVGVVIIVAGISGAIRTIARLRGGGSGMVLPGVFSGAPPFSGMPPFSAPGAVTSAPPLFGGSPGGAVPAAPMGMSSPLPPPPVHAAPPAGWYPDPRTGTGQVWWDGSQWVGLA